MGRTIISPRVMRRVMDVPPKVGSQRMSMVPSPVLSVDLREFFQILAPGRLPVYPPRQNCYPLNIHPHINLPLNTP